jgi:hypothetical protein
MWSIMVNAVRQRYRMGSYLRWRRQPSVTTTTLAGAVQRSRWADGRTTTTPSHTVLAEHTVCSTMGDQRHPLSDSPARVS